MAFTVSNIINTVFGNQGVVFQRITPDAAEGTVVTGLPSIVATIVSQRKSATFIASGNTAQSYVNYVENAGTTGTAALGTIGFSGCVANNIFYAISFGPR